MKETWRWLRSCGIAHASDATPTAMAVGTLILRGAMVGRAVSMCARYVGGEVEGRAEM